MWCSNANSAGSELIAISLLFTFALCCLNANLLVVLLQSCKVFTCFREFTLFHAFSNIPMHKCTLRGHQVEFVVNAREDLGDGSGITDHAASTHDLGQISTGHNCWGLVVDAAFESGRGP